MKPETTFTPVLSPDALALGRRLVADFGIADGALMVPHADVAGLVAIARGYGEQLAMADINQDRHCRVCGCSQFNACRPEPCAWAGSDLCTACAPYVEGGR